MLKNTLIRNILVSLVVALLAPLLLILLDVLPGWQGGLGVKSYLVAFALLMLGSSINELLRLKAAQPSSPRRAAKPSAAAAVSEGPDEREEGVVKWFNVNKGFGFIIRDLGGEVFVHFRSIRGSGHRTLREGQRVRFQTVEGDKGLQAEDVSISSR